MRFFILILFAFIPIFLAATTETTYEEQGNYLTIKNGGPIAYHIDLKNPFRFVDPSTQLEAIASNMINTNPEIIFDIGFGVGLLARPFIHLYKNLEVYGCDIDSRVPILYGEIYHQYLKESVSLEEANDRLKIYPDDAKVLIAESLRGQEFDVIWFDIMDDNYDDESNLLFNHDFLLKLTKRLKDHGGIVVALNDASMNDLKRIKNFAKASVAIHLTLDSSSDASKFSVLILTNHKQVSCKKLDNAYSSLGNTINIKKPHCKLV